MRHSRAIFVGFILTSTLSVLSCKPVTKYAGETRKPAESLALQEEGESAQHTLSAVPAGATIKGSFTIWSEPAKPLVGEAYKVFIRVKLPVDLSTYAKNDLSGQLVGSDKYVQSFQGSQGSLDFPNSYGSAKQKFAFSPGSGYAELVLPIVGSPHASVEDTLTVKSVLLGEAHKVVIRSKNK